jgi:hypothetical protein
VPSAHATLVACGNHARGRSQPRPRWTETEAFPPRTQRFTIAVHRCATREARPGRRRTQEPRQSRRTAGSYTQDCISGRAPHFTDAPHSGCQTCSNSRVHKFRVPSSEFARAEAREPSAVGFGEFALRVPAIGLDAASPECPCEIEAGAVSAVAEDPNSIEAPLHCHPVGSRPAGDLSRANLLFRAEYRRTPIRSRAQQSQEQTGSGPEGTTMGPPTSQRVAPHPRPSNYCRSLITDS